MIRVVTLVLTLATLSATTAAAPVRTWVGPSGESWAQSGVLTRASPKSATEIATRFVSVTPGARVGAADSELVSTEIPVRDGSLVRLAQTHAGLPVVGGGVVVRVDRQGRVRWFASRVRAIPPSFRSVASVTSDIAVDAAVGASLMSSARARRAAARLIVHVLPQQPPRLAYEVELPIDRVRHEAIRAYVDANTGEVYLRHNLAMSAGPHANVFDENPTTTPELSLIEFEQLEPGAPLATEDLTTLSCVDRNSCVEFFDDFFVHDCEYDVLATPNAQGDYSDYTYQSDTDRGDAFAEVQLFFHVTRAFDKARSLGGFSNLEQRPLPVRANVLQTDYDSSACDGTTYTGGAPLEALNNAYYYPPFGDQGGLYFGQGTQVDFGYDGEVAYHEFGHALMHTVAPELGAGYPDAYGFNPLQAGLHEGYADVFAMFVSGDPDLAEYASAGFGDEERRALRSMDNDKRCPNNISGESHEDGLIITGALWEVRTAVATTDDARRAFDAAVFTAQRAFGADTDFVQAAALTVMEIEASLGSEAANTASDIFAARGISECARVVDRSTPAETFLFLVDSERTGMSPSPAPVQFRYELTEPATELIVQGTLPPEYKDAIGAGFTFDVSVIAKSGGAPIEFVGEDSDHTAAASWNMDEDRAVLRGEFGPGVYHLMLTNSGDTMLLHDLVVSHTAAPSVGPDAGPGEPEPGDPAGGCGCGTTPPGGLLGTLVILGIAFAFRRRRRYTGVRR